MKHCWYEVHWYEVRRYIDGKHDPVVTSHRTRKQAQKAEQEALATGKYECVYYEEYDEDGIVD